MKKLTPILLSMVVLLFVCLILQTGLGIGLFSPAEADNECEVSRLEEYESSRYKTENENSFEGDVFKYSLSMIVRHFNPETFRTETIENDPNEVNFCKDFTHSPPIILS